MKPPQKRPDPRPEKLTDRLPGATIMISTRDQNTEETRRIQELLEDNGAKVVLLDTKPFTVESASDLFKIVETQEPTVILIVNPAQSPHGVTDGGLANLFATLRDRFLQNRTALIVSHVPSHRVMNKFNDRNIPCYDINTPPEILVDAICEQILKQKLLQNSTESRTR